MAKSLIDSIGAGLEPIGKAAIVAAGVAYSIGFILVSFDLARYGVMTSLRHGR